MSTYLERALFVVAPQNFGKSTLLRSMFNDPRLGNDGDLKRGGFVTSSGSVASVGYICV